MSDRKIRVLIFITRLELGGAQKKQLYFMRHLSREKFDVSLLAGSGGMLDAEARQIPGARVFLWDSVRHQIHPFWDLWAVFKLARFLKKESIDVVYTHSSKAGVIGRLAARLAGVKVVHHYHGFAFHERQNLILRAFYVAVEKFAAGCADLLLCDAHENIQKALANGIGRPEQFQVLRCGIDTQELLRIPADSAGLRQEFQIPASAPVVGTVGNFKSQKSPMDLLRVAETVISRRPDTFFFLAGDGPERPMLESRIAQSSHPRQIILAGWRRDIASVYQLMDVFYLMSLWEGLPTVLSEAKWFGVPVVATAVDGTKEAIEDGVTGFLVPPGAVDLASDRIISLLTNPDIRRSVGSTAKSKLFPEYDLKNTLPNLEHILLRVSSRQS